MKKTKRPIRVGFFGLDPGGTSGVCEGWIPLAGDTKEAFAAGEWRSYQIDCWDMNVDPQFAEQPGIEELEDRFMEWNRTCMERVIPVERRYFIQEDFLLRETGIGSTDRFGLSPVRITSSMLSLTREWGGNYVFQQPSQAKSTITNQRLRNLGLWLKGMGTPRLEHGADATRHTALWARSVL